MQRGAIRAHSWTIQGNVVGIQLPAPLSIQQVDNGKALTVFGGYMGIMEKKMEATIMVYINGDILGIMEKKRETIRKGYIGVLLG